MAGASIGAATGSEHADVLLRHADVAMYHAKRSAGRQYVHHSELAASGTAAPVPAAA